MASLDLGGPFGHQVGERMVPVVLGEAFEPLAQSTRGRQLSLLGAVPFSNSGLEMSSLS